MRKILLATILALSPFIVGWTLTWDKVTTYTDGTPINDDNVVYTAYQDGAPIATNISDNWVSNLAVQRGNSYSYTVRAKLVRQGTYSDNSVPFAWSWPAGKAGAPGQLRVVP